MLQFEQVLYLVLAGLSLVWQTGAQGTSNVTCTTAIWTFNDEHQSPCEVGAILETPCLGGRGINVSPLPPNKGYSGAPAGLSNKCFCSSVTYSMLSACAACQGGGLVMWSAWIENCVTSDISIAAYPPAIPLNTSVPAWAYLDVTVTGIWDMDAAQANQSSGAPESSAGAPKSTSTIQSSSSLSSTTPVSSVTTPISPATTGSSASSSHAGAIAGGVVGGLVALVAAILLTCILYRRRIRYMRHTERIQSQREKMDLGESTAPTHMVTTEYIPVQMTTQPPKLYNPSDPSTFPPTPQPSLPAYTVSTFTDSDATSPTFTGPFSVTSSAPHDPLSGQHGGQVSIGTSSASTVTQSVQHSHNLSGGTTTSFAAPQQQVGYSGIPEL